MSLQMPPSSLNESPGHRACTFYLVERPPPSSPPRRATADITPISLFEVCGQIQIQIPLAPRLRSPLPSLRLPHTSMSQQTYFEYNTNGMPFRLLGNSGLRVPLFSLGGCEYQYQSHRRAACV